MEATAAVAVVLAAGKSTRMKSTVPKVLHEVCGRPMVQYVLEAARHAGARRIVVIVGHGAEQVEAALAGQHDVEFALQAEQKGTGHAVMMSKQALANHRGPVLILTGDAPLMKAASFSALLQEFQSQSAACVIGTAITENNFGLGRIVRDQNGAFQKIVEEKDATPQERKITEVNVGCYVIDGPSLFTALDEIRPDNKQGELYLTDVAAILKRQGRHVVASPRLEIAEALGVNTRQQLAEVQEEMQQDCRKRLMSEGVSIPAPHQTYIDPMAEIGADSIIYPFSVILGPAILGRNCRIGPHAVIQAPVRLADGAVVKPFETVGPE